MTDLRKAAEAVLEAWGWDWSEPRNEALRERMEALRQALAQPEQYDQTALELCDVCGWKAIIPDEGCLVCARKNQMPVAWGEFKGDKLHDLFCTKYDADNIKKFRKDESVVKPLYTAPPKREWVGLTDEDRSDLLTQHHGWNEFGIAIEAKLKEKNT